jgi:hypothetical protein
MEILTSHFYSSLTKENYNIIVSVCFIEKAMKVDAGLGLTNTRKPTLTQKLTLSVILTTR